MENNTARAEFLQNALDAVNALSEKRKQYAEEQKRFRDSERNYDALKKKIETEKENAIRTRRAAMETEYENRLRDAEEKIADAEKRRKTARNSAMNDRVKIKTAEPKARIAEYRKDIYRVLKESRVSRICGTALFQFMYYPCGILDILKMAGVFILMLVLIPLLVTLFIKATWVKILVFALIDVIFVALYFMIYNRTIAGKPWAFTECRAIVKKIHAVKKEVSGITRDIHKDTDDSCYNLNSFDAELTRLNQEKNDIVIKKQEAQAEFEKETILRIKEETDAANAEEMDKVRQEFTESSETIKKLAEIIAGDEAVLNGTYLQEIGEENMTPEGIAQLLEEENKKNMKPTEPEVPGPETKG